MVSIVDIDPDDPARDAEFRAWVDVFLESARHELGDDHAGRTVAERRVRFRDASRRAIGVLARDEEGALVGAGWVVMPLLDNLRLAMVDLAVRPGHRRRGYGRALLCHLEGLAREHGRSLLVAQTQWHADGTDRSGGFASRVGYAAAQTNLRSSLALPVERNRLEAVLAERDGDGYALVTHVGGIPDDLLGARAELSRRMSTDVPLGDLQLEEEEWDEDRVRKEYQRYVEAGRTTVDTFALAPDGSAAGYTQVAIAADPTLVYQQDTLVVREHRGHGLGLRMKAENTLAVMAHSPVSRWVRTWNADDNAPMLAVNRALGYAVDACMREWQKELG